MKRVLVVGGAGYIGGLTVDRLREAGYGVTVYDGLLYEPRFLKNTPFIFGDVRDTKKLLAIEKEFDRIIWLAAIVGDGACQQNPELTTEINLTSIKRFLKKCKRKVVFTSTCSVYGAQDGMLTEESPTKPLSLYASTKVEAEQYVLDHGGLVFRLGTLFGLGDRYSRIRLDLVVNIMTLTALRQGKLIVYGGDQWRPVISVSDVADYLTEAVEHDEAEIYNVKFRNITMHDLAQKIGKVFPEVGIETTQLKFEDMRNYRVDSSKVNLAFEFKPHTTIESEVQKMKRLFSEHRIKNFDDEIYYNTHYVRLLVQNGFGGL